MTIFVSFQGFAELSRVLPSEHEVDRMPPVAVSVPRAIARGCRHSDEFNEPVAIAPGSDTDVLDSCVSTPSDSEGMPPLKLPVAIKGTGRYRSRF